MRRAANYMLNEWDGLEAITAGGDYSWDNNLIERLNRYISLSRKNPLFFGSQAGAQRGSVFFPQAWSCRLHGINFFEYPSDIGQTVFFQYEGAEYQGFYINLQTVHLQHCQSICYSNSMTKATALKHFSR